MADERRRDFLARASRAGLGLGLLRSPLARGESQPRATAFRGRVVIARDVTLASGAPQEHAALVQKLLDAAVVRLSGAQDPVVAWRSLFRPRERIGIKVNSLGLPTQPVVAYAIAECLTRAGVAPQRIVIWDRLDVELDRVGYRINRSGSGVRCRGTDVDGVGQGYDPNLMLSGAVGSCFSRIVTEEVDALISVPVLKDHNLAGVSLGLKNFYGAIHNPNKYHDNNCDPYVADLAAHPQIRAKWRLTVCDATRAQFHAGPGRAPQYGWDFGGLLLAADGVAADAVGAALIEEQRQRHGLPTLAKDGRSPKHIASAAARGLGEADLGKIERVEV